MQYATFFIALLSLGTLHAQIAPGDSVAHLEILHEEHFPRPPFLIYFENALPADNNVLSEVASKTPVFYVAVNTTPESPESLHAQQYPVVIYDPYGGFAQEVGIDILPTSVVIGENYVVKKVMPGAIDSHGLDSNTISS